MVHVSLPLLCPLTEERWEKENQVGEYHLWDTEKKNFPLLSKPRGCLALLHHVVSILSVHWEAERNVLGSTEYVGVRGIGVYVVRGSWDL